MGKSKALELPAPPTYNKPELGIANNGLLSDYGKQLSSGDFSGNLSWLNPTINNNNSANSLAYAQGLLAPQFRNNIQDITNQAIANNQNTSSTFTDSLAKASGDTNSAYQAILAQQAIADSNQSNQNRIGLFGEGLNTLQQSIGNDAGFSGAENSFNLDNYSNLVAKAIQDNKNSNTLNGFQQALAFNPIGHDYYQSQGFNQVPGYGVADVAKIASLFVPGNGLNSQKGLDTSTLGWNLRTPDQNARSFQSAPFSGAYASNGR